LGRSVLIVGSGGREHALAWKLTQSPSVDKVFAIPGNGGIAQVATCVEARDNNTIIQFAEANKIDLMVVGPEAYLVSGLIDLAASKGLAAFGPKQAAAQIEGSKSFAKRLMTKYAIPTARAVEVVNYDEALQALKSFPEQVVIKADGLAAGKGVVVADSHEEAAQALSDCLVSGKFGAAGSRALIEERLTGPEVSVLAITDGKTTLPLPAAQDYKRAGDGDTGPNTGGMGCYSPVPVLSDKDYQAVLATIIEPTIQGLAREGIDYKGVLYAGIMLTQNGPKVLEYNARFGDPETQVILPRLDCDLYELLMATATGNLAGMEARRLDQRAVSVVLASRGYPEAPESGKPINGLADAAALDGVQVFHAGTKLEGDQIVTAGGRVLNVTALGTTFAEARRQAYRACDMISFEGMQFRRDIGERAEAAEAGSG